MKSYIQPPLAPLFVPGNRPERFGKAASSGADAVILDLEDAVAPDLKDSARKAIQSHGITAVPVIVRVNARSTPWFADDLAALSGVSVSAVMLAKAENDTDITAIHTSLGRDIPVIPLVETARGVAELSSLLSAQRVSVAAFGSLDFSVDLGCSSSWEALLLARSEVVLRSRLAGLPSPLDGVTTSLDDPAVVETEARRAADLGYGGKLAIHPTQIIPIRRGFLPDAHMKLWAEKVVAAASGAAEGAVRVDGAMVDPPLVAKAQLILAQVAKSQGYA
jgi:citrate lyase subunit beta/citryl-CoA lyase